MIEYVAAAWLTTCDSEKVEQLCFSLPPGKSFSMVSMSAFTIDGHPLEDWCIINERVDGESYANMVFVGGKTIIQMGVGMKPCVPKECKGDDCRPVS